MAGHQRGQPRGGQPRLPGLDNPAMCRHPILTVIMGLAGLLTACSPTFNWRESSIGATNLAAMFPCKPETVTRTLPIGNADRDMTMRTCDAGGVTFAVAHARLADPLQVPAALTGWRTSTLAGLGADPALATSQRPQGVAALPQMLVLQAATAPSNRAPRALTAVWFAQGVDVFAAFVMAPTIPADAVEPFFAGLRLR